MAEPVFEIKGESGVRYTVPSSLHLSRMADTQVVRFRVGDVYKNCDLTVYYNDTCVTRIHKKVIAPGEMEQIILVKSKLAAEKELSRITVTVEKGGTKA